LLPALNEKLATDIFTTTHLLMIWMALLKHDLTDLTTDKLFDSLLSRRIVHSMADYASLVYCYSQCDRKLVDTYTLRRLADYPRKDLFNISISDISTLMYALGTLP